MKKMAVIGAGAIGSLLGGYITLAGKDIILIDSWYEHVNVMRQIGLKIGGTRGNHLINVKAIDINEVRYLKDKLEIVFIAVKSYNTEKMLRTVQPHLNNNAWIISCQNGINEDIIGRIVGANSTLGCVVYMGGLLLGPGHVVETGDVAAFTVGELDGQITPRVREVAKLTRLCADTQITTNLFGIRWSKLALNCMSNPLSPLTGCDHRQLCESTRVRGIFRLIVVELIKVAEALGYTVDPILGQRVEVWKKSEYVELPEIKEALIKHGKHLGNRQLSLAQDLIKGRPTEIDYLNGYVATKGKEVGIQTPANEAVLALIKDLERKKIEPDLVNIDALWKLI